MTCPSEQCDFGQQSLEIERVFLLSRLPDLPASALKYCLMQGYLPKPAETDGENPVEGRLRQTTKSDGSTIYTHTIKRGLGLIRQETEREISQQEFQKLWPGTEGRRLTKTRYFVKEDENLWEVDDFDDLDVVMAEIELAEPDTPITLPDWLKACLIREVTEEPAYRSYYLALAKTNAGPDAFG